MNLEFGQLGQTIALGALSLYGFLFLSRLFFNNLLLKELSPPKSDDLKLLYTAVYLALVFALGILIEDLSKNVVAERLTELKHFQYLKPAFEKLLPKDKYLRLKSLYDISKYSDSLMVIAKPRLIAVELIESRLFEKYGGASGDKIQKLYDRDLRTKDSVFTYKDSTYHDLDVAIGQLYYHSKNIVYHESNYFNELTRIESRLDFARSLTFISLCLLILHLFCLIIYYSYYLLTKVLHRNKTIHLRWGLHIALLGIFSLSCLLGSISFESEQNNYNLRVFGYFRSLYVDQGEITNKKFTEETVQGKK